MKLRQLITAFALALPAITFAQPLDTRDGDACKASLSAKTFWTAQYAILVAHAAKALTNGDNLDAKNTLSVAQRAGSMGCVTKPSANFTTIVRSLAKIDIEQAMLDAARMVAKSEYVDARDLLEDIASFAVKNNLSVPESLPTLQRTAADGANAAFFVSLDKAVAEKKLTTEQASTRERNLCRRIAEAKLTVPERCTNVK